MSLACKPVRSLPLYAGEDCALTRCFLTLSPFKTHDWFSDALTGGLILGLWISYAPQVKDAFAISPTKFETLID
jgi:hypothetical protein